MIAGSGGLSAAITAMLSRRPSMAAVFAENYRDVVERLTKVEARVDTLEGELSEERKGHGLTREMLRVALRFIHDVVAWAAGPRITEPPAPPADLMREI